MSATIEAPVAAGPKPPGGTFPSSSGEIKVSGMSKPAATAKPAAAPKAAAAPVAPAATPEAAKPKSAMSEVMGALRDKVKDANGAVEPKPDKATEATKAPDEIFSKNDLLDDSEAGEAKSEAAATSEAAAEKTEKTEKKINPWKTIKERDTIISQKEKELADLKKMLVDPEARKVEHEKWTKVEQRNKELEEHIKFVDYSKSGEFVEKYQKPYQESWGRAMGELKEVTFSDPLSGEERAMQPADLLELVNMPMVKAREKAEELYGSAANEIMAFRKEIRSLHESQAKALEKAKTEGAKHFEERAAEAKRQQEQIAEFSSKTWQEVNDAITKNEKSGEYFRPVEGNEEVNGRLERGYKLVDEAMQASPFDPRLTPEQRKKVIERHAAVRARAAAFGRIRYELEQERAAHAAALKKLEAYESSEPGTEAGQKLSAAPGNSSAKDSVFTALRRLAK